MPGSLIIGDIKKVEFCTDETFDEATAATLIVFDTFADEGNEWPDPELLTQALSDGQEGATGTDVPFSLRVLKADKADIDTLSNAGFTLERYYVRFTGEDGTQAVLQPLIPRATHGMPTGRGSYGVAKVMGKATGIMPADTYSVTQTSST